MARVSAIARTLRTMDACAEFEANFGEGRGETIALEMIQHCCDDNVLCHFRSDRSGCVEWSLPIKMVSNSFYIVGCSVQST